MVGSSSLVESANQDRAMAELGFVEPQVYNALIRSPRVLRLVEDRLSDSIVALPDLDDALRDDLENLFEMASSQLDHLACGLVAFAQAPKIASSTDGRELSAVAEFCGDKSILNFLRAQKEFAPGPLLVVEEISMQELSGQLPLSRALILGALTAHHRSLLFLMGVIEPQELDSIELQSSERNLLLKCIRMVSDHIRDSVAASAKAMNEVDDYEGD